MKLPRADTAESHCAGAVFHAACKHAAITVLQISAKIVRQPPSDNGPHRVNHIFCRQAVSPCQYRLPGWFLVALPCLPSPALHIVPAFRTQPYPRRAVNDIIYTSVAWDKTSQHLRIGGIYNGVHGKSCDITLPYGQFVRAGMAAPVLLSRIRNLRKRNNPFFPCLVRQKLVLYLKHFLRHITGHTDIHKGSERHSLFLIFLTRLQIPVLPGILLKFPEQIIQPRFLFTFLHHCGTPLSYVCFLI